MAIAPHPAAHMVIEDRLVYLRTVVSIALADGRTEPRELEKLRRLVRVLELPSSALDEVLTALRAARGSGDAVPGASAAQVAGFRGLRAVRSYLVMDAIAIAFSDAELVPAESRRIAELAHLVGVEPDEIYMLAGFVEKILFKRDADSRVLAAELGVAVGAPGAGEGLVEMVRRVAGEQGEA